MSFIFKNIFKSAAESEADKENDLLFTAPALSYSEEIERLKERVSCAYDNLDNVVDPLLIDSWIYEINAAQLRYQFCLQQLKQPSAQLLDKEKTGVV